MHIAYITDQLLPQTATDTRQMIAMVAAMGAAGADVTVVAPARWLKKPASVEEIAAYYEVAPCFNVAYVRSVYPNIRGIEKLVQGATGPRQAAAREADLIYTRTLPILLGALSAGRRVLYETYRPWPDQRPMSAPFFRWIGRQPHFIGAVLHSHLAQESYVYAGMPAEKMLVAHNGYDPSLLHPILTQEEARRKCALPLDKPVVVYTGRMNRKKGLDLVLEMAAARTDFLFVLVGSEGEGTVERRAARFENVRMVPWMEVSRTVPYLYAADVLLIPPVSGPLHKVGNTVLPLKTFLYMAAERAILAPDTPDLRELLEEGKNAALARPDDLEDALEHLDRLVNNLGLRKRLAQQAHADVIDQTWERRAERVLAFIESRLQVARASA